jgi:hypothetical protein
MATHTRILANAATKLILYPRRRDAHQPKQGRSRNSPEFRDGFLGTSTDCCTWCHAPLRHRRTGFQPVRPTGTGWKLSYERHRKDTRPQPASVDNHFCEPSDARLVSFWPVAVFTVWHRTPRTAIAASCWQMASQLPVEQPYPCVHWSLSRWLRGSAFLTFAQEFLNDAIVIHILLGESFSFAIVSS